MTVSDDRERRERDRYVRRVLDTCGMSDILSYLQVPLVCLPRAINALLPARLSVKPPPDPVTFQVITQNEITVSVQRYGAEPLVDMSDQDVQKVLSAKIDEMLLGVPPYDPNAPAQSTTLTLEDLQRAYDTLSGYGASPFAPQPMPPGPPSPMFAKGSYAGPIPGVPIADPQLERLLRDSGCRERGCYVSIGYSFLHLGTLLEHNDQKCLIDDVVRRRFGSSMDEIRALFLRWTYQLHGGRVADAPEPFRNICYLCGEQRDPDVEPIVLDAEALYPALAKLGSGTAIHGATIEACSRECATAYAISLEPMRSQPALGRALEQRHDEREMIAARAQNVKEGLVRGEITDSKPTRGKPRHHWW